MPRFALQVYHKPGSHETTPTTGHSGTERRFRARAPVGLGNIAAMRHGDARMFSYVDPSVKDELLRTGRLVSIDENGKQLSPSDGAATPFISLVGPVPLPVRVGTSVEWFQWYAWVRHSDLSRIESAVEKVRKEGPRTVFALLAAHMSVNSILIRGDFAQEPDPLVRIHSNCLTGDVFGSMRCDCGPQLQLALGRIATEKAGALVYMAGHEGRGIGLWAKAITYLLQDAGHDTYQANERLGLPADSRDFRDAGRVLLHFLAGGTRVRLLGNNPTKRGAVEEVGVRVVEQIPLVSGVNPYNVRYLRSKREHGHIFPVDSLQTLSSLPPKR